MGSMWVLCGFVGDRRLRRWNEDLGGFYSIQLGYCNFGVWVMRTFSWKYVVCVTLERGEEQGIVLHLCVFQWKMAEIFQNVLFKDHVFRRRESIIY